MYKQLFTNLKPTATSGILILFSKLSFVISSLLISIMISRTLGTEGFGIYSLLIGLYLIFEIPSQLGLENIVIREVSRNSEEIKTVFTHSLIMGAVSSLFCAVVMLMLCGIFDYSSEVQDASKLIVLLFFPSFAYLILETIFIALHKVKYVFAVSILRDTLLTIFCLLLLSNGAGIQAIIMASFLSRLLAVLIMYCMSCRQGIELFCPIKPAYFKNLMPQTFIFLMSAVFANLFFEVDTLILSLLLPIDEFGIYSLAKRMFKNGIIFYFSFITAAFPLLSKAEYLPAAEKKMLHRNIMSILATGMLFVIALNLILSGTFIRLFFGEVYLAARDSLKILIWALLPMSYTFLFSRLLIIKHRQKQNLYAIIAATVCVALTGLLFSIYWGAIGMSLAFLFSATAMFLMLYYYLYWQNDSGTSI